MSIGTIASVELDSVKWWQDSFNPALVNNATLAVTADLVYLCPVELIDLHGWLTTRFKFLYVGVGLAWGFTFRLSLFKMLRGTGGTAATYVSVGSLGTITLAPPSLPIGTAYVCAVPTTLSTTPLESGTYAIGMQWDDTSSIGSSITFTAYGTLLTTDNGWYVSDGTSAGSMPTTIATVGSAQLFQPYWENN